MRAAKDAGEEYYDPAREDNIRGRNKTRLALWKEHLKDPIVALDEALKCVENSCQKVFARLQSLWERPIWESVWLYSDLMDCVCAQRPWSGMCQGSNGPHGEVFFFLIQKEPAMVSGSENFSTFFNADIRTSFFSADVFKKCALIALHSCGIRKRL